MLLYPIFVAFSCYFLLFRVNVNIRLLEWTLLCCWVFVRLLIFYIKIVSDKSLTRFYFGSNAELQSRCFCLFVCILLSHSVLQTNRTSTFLWRTCWHVAWTTSRAGVFWMARRRSQGRSFWSEVVCHWWQKDTATHWCFPASSAPCSGSVREETRFCRTQTNVSYPLNLA